MDAPATRIAAFVGTIRANGFPIGVGETTDALRVAQTTGIMARDPLFWGWRSLLCARAEEWHRFNDLFDSFWLPPNSQALVESHASGAGKVELDPADSSDGGKAGPTIQHCEEGGASNNQGATKEGASATSSAEEADFRTLMDPNHARRLEPLIRRFAHRLRRIKTRREDSEARGRRLDLRHTLRRSVGAGGLPTRLCFRAPRRVRPRLVLLLDVSRSMSLYSFFLSSGGARACGRTDGCPRLFVPYAPDERVRCAVRSGPLAGAGAAPASVGRLGPAGRVSVNVSPSSIGNIPGGSCIRAPR